jgi:quercetin dioxygenase-like cupin family protein
VGTSAQANDTEKEMFSIGIAPVAEQVWERWTVKLKRLISGKRDVVIRLPGEGIQGKTSTGMPLLIRVTGADTGGRIGVVELDEAPRNNAAIHVHDSDEAWYILSGEYRLFAGGRWFAAPAGSFIFVPGGVPHGFAVLPGVQARKVAFSLPGGLEGAYLPEEQKNESTKMPQSVGIETLPDSEK